MKLDLATSTNYTQCLLKCFGDGADGMCLDDWVKLQSTFSSRREKYAKHINNSGRPLTTSFTGTRKSYWHYKAKQEVVELDNMGDSSVDSPTVKLKFRADKNNVYAAFSTSPTFLSFVTVQHRKKMMACFVALSGHHVVLPKMHKGAALITITRLPFNLDSLEAVLNLAVVHVQSVEAATQPASSMRVTERKRDDRRQVPKSRCEEERFMKEDMAQLYAKAESFVNSGASMRGFESVFRCKPKSYWEEIKRNAGLMCAYVKDKNGNKKSLINGMIKGLFFSTKKEKTSPFGDMRLELCAERILGGKQRRFYFADFYCHKQPHHVTVVVCSTGSATNKHVNPRTSVWLRIVFRYCREKLVPLPGQDNPFLRALSDGNSDTFKVTRKANVEIFYTADVHLLERELAGLELVKPSGIGRSRVEGIPINKNCHVCKMQREECRSNSDYPQDYSLTLAFRNSVERHATT